MVALPHLRGERGQGNPMGQDHPSESLTLGVCYLQPRRRSRGCVGVLTEGSSEHRLYWTMALPRWTFPLLI